MGGGRILTKECIKQFRDTGRILLCNPDFAYLLPHPALGRWISNYTITFPGPGLMSDQYTVMPHGCATLVFSCGEDGIWGRLFGSMTKPACVGQGANASAMLFIIEFQPAGFYAFSGIPQKELADHVFPFDVIHPSFNKVMTQYLELAQDMGQFIAAVDRLFLAHLNSNLLSQEFALANQLIVCSGGQLSVKELVQHIFYSERHLNRLFNQQMGMNAKSFSRLVRINRALRLLQRPSLGILQVCLETGFYDVPHFIHDFKATCGITPLEYRDTMSDFYSEIAKF